MNKSVKVLLGLATLLQFVFIAMFFVIFFLIVSYAPTHDFEEYFSRNIEILNPVSLPITLFFTAIWIFYIVHAARNPNLEATGMRTTWIVGLVILGALVEPFYWFHHIWRDGALPSKSGPLGLN